MSSIIINTKRTASPLCGSLRCAVVSVVRSTFILSAVVGASFAFSLPFARRRQHTFHLAMRCHRHNQASTGAKHRCEPCVAVGDGGTAVAGSGCPFLKRAFLLVSYKLVKTFNSYHQLLKDINMEL